MILEEGVMSGYSPATTLLLPSCCGSNTSLSHVVCCHIYIVALWAIEKVNLLLNCVPARYCLPQLGQAPLGEDTLKNTELCASEPEHTLQFLPRRCPSARLPALSGTPRPYPVPPTPNLQTVP